MEEPQAFPLPATSLSHRISHPVCPRVAIPAVPGVTSMFQLQLDDLLYN